MANNLDDEARAELLTHLVVGQLVAQARTGEWLRTDHLVESTRIWLNSNGVDDADWTERVRIGTLSQLIALDFIGLSRFWHADSLVKLFTDGWRLDYRSPIVRGIHAACERQMNGDA
jgi:hypothetical protein